MKILIIVALLLSGVASAKDVYVHGYTRSNGTYVQPHHRSAPDNNPYNNYSYTQPQPHYQQPAYNNFGSHDQDSRNMNHRGSGSYEPSVKVSPFDN